MKWKDAHDYCRRQGGALAYFNNQEEYDLFTKDLDFSANNGWNVWYKEWLGIRRMGTEFRQNGSYEGWESIGYINIRKKEQLFFKWKSDEPNNSRNYKSYSGRYGNRQESCVEFDINDLQWNDLRCNKRMRFHCRFDDC
ncbi:Oidioi.mRNA.OKI2018_I69.chr1.g551.t1.cds [Oikopleura dioica]|uniref:Oidioi.mRNA.OKI2018_I69.chr1.g551.t1.cds n=1 Tax=Oikopleura dioica TaxID=34765 RepID=A0ABN7SK72_OIKDI|nr:Oidioi.mRNA.OKI2018_I69.chr1.g551.t1.cds [Oikopleura dioica]